MNDMYVKGLQDSVLWFELNVNNPCLGRGICIVRKECRFWRKKTFTEVVKVTVWTILGILMDIIVRDRLFKKKGYIEIDVYK